MHEKWNSSPINDFYADTLLSEVLKIEIEHSKSSPAGGSSSRGVEKRSSIRENILLALGEMYNKLDVVDEKADEQLVINVEDRRLVSIDLNTFAVNCDDDKQLESLVFNIVNQVKYF